MSMVSLCIIMSTTEVATVFGKWKRLDKYGAGIIWKRVNLRVKQSKCANHGVFFYRYSYRGSRVAKRGSVFPQAQASI